LSSYATTFIVTGPLRRVEVSKLYDHDVVPDTVFHSPPLILILTVDIEPSGSFAVPSIFTIFSVTVAPFSGEVMVIVGLRFPPWLLTVTYIILSEKLSFIS